MKTFILFPLFCVSLFFSSLVSAKELDFTVTRLGSQTEEQPKEHLAQKLPHLMVIGGIQGDEPGSFSAAALLATQYEIKHGSVTIVPNLNFISIIDRKRGSFGDMNRKFADLDEKDPQYHIVRRIQALLVEPQVDLILNLHDGSGYYHPKYISKLQNPKRWGNCIIIDQEGFESDSYGNLLEIAESVSGKINEDVLEKLHAFHVKNTKTGEGDEEMAKSLTWFALNKGKPAFGIEASKNLLVADRAYYHLLALEAFMSEMGIVFERKFPLTPKGVKVALSSEIYIGFNDNRLVLPVNNIRKNQLGSFPIEKKDIPCSANSPILMAMPDKNRSVKIHYGNNRLSTFRADWHELDKSLEACTVLVDGQPKNVKFGSIIYAKSYINVESIEGYRVNAIGAVVGKNARADESGKNIYKKDFQTRYSIDNSGTSYRVEMYKEKKYVGTFVVKFQSNADKIIASPLPAIKGPESDLGR